MTKEVSPTQLMFDTVATHLLKQGERAGDEVFGCYYRWNGLKCAIGVLIPDDMYVPEMECGGVGILLTKYPTLKEYVPNKWLAVALQEMHDYVSPAKWKEKLVEIALQYNLNTSVLGS